MKRFVCCGGLVLLALLLAGCAGLAGEPAIVGTIPATATTVAQPVSLPQSPPDLTLGASVFAANCTRCHGLSAKGDGELVQSGQVPALMDFTDPLTAQDYAPLDWYEIVTNGRLDKLMPPWGSKLTDAERWSVTLYLYTLANTGKQIAQGQVVWADKCAECHGETGAGTSKGAPLPDLLKISTNDALAALAAGIPDKMPAFADDLTTDQRAAVIAYARTLRLAGQPVEVAQAATGAAVVAPLATQEIVAPLATQEVVAPSATQEVGSVMGVVAGVVTNGTAGAVVPADLPINLHVISADAQAAAQTFESKVIADGSYHFADVPFAAGLKYVVTTLFESAPFSSEVVAGDPANPQLTLPLNIYEVTDDPASISVNGVLMMLQPDTQPGQLEVVQIVSFSNASDRAFLRQTGTGTASLSVRLPTGATYEDFSGGSYQISANGSEISDTQAVLPGDAHVMHLAYTVPYSGSVSLAQPLDYPLNGSVEILAAVGGVSVSGSEISALGTRQMGDRSFTSFGGTYQRAAGDTLQFQVSGAAAVVPTAPAPGGVSIVAYILIGIGLLAIGAAFGFFMRERTSAAARPRPDANDLIRQIADLDVRYKDGKLSEASYREQRRALKAQLTARLKAQAQDDDSAEA